MPAADRNDSNNQLDVDREKERDRDRERDKERDLDRGERGSKAKSPSAKGTNVLLFLHIALINQY